MNLLFFIRTSKIIEVILASNYFLLRVRFVISVPVPRILFEKFKKLETNVTEKYHFWYRTGTRAGFTK